MSTEGFLIEMKVCCGGRRDREVEARVVGVAAQVEGLKARVGELDAAVRAKARVEAALAAAEQQRDEASEKLRRALREGEALQHEVGGMSSTCTCLSCSSYRMVWCNMVN